MVPVATRAPNITNISCWKIAPKPLVYIGPRIVYFQNFYVYLINLYLTVWGITIEFPQLPLFKKM